MWNIQTEALVFKILWSSTPFVVGIVGWLIKRDLGRTDSAIDRLYNEDKDIHVRITAQEKHLHDRITAIDKMLERLHGEHNAIHGITIKPKPKKKKVKI